MKPIALLIPGLLVAALFLMAACSGGQDAPAQTEPEPVAPTAYSGSGGGGGGTGSGSGGGTGGGSGNGSGEAGSFGQRLFTGSAGCAACHAIEGVSEGLVGPDLTKIGAGAGSRKSGMSARDYIEESIRDPEAFVAEGVDRAIAGIMTQEITAGLSDEQVVVLVDFLADQR